MLYPKVARIDCNDCKKYSYNLRTGKRNEYEVDDGKMLPIVRIAPPPCESCPKKSPERGKQLRLRPENQRMLDFYQRLKALPGMRTRLLDCPVFQRNLRLIDRVFDMAKAKQMTRARKRAERNMDDAR